LSLVPARDPRPQEPALEAPALGRTWKIDGGVEKAAGEIQIGDGKRRHFDRQRLLADGFDEVLAVWRRTGDRFHAPSSRLRRSGAKRPSVGIGCGRGDLEPPSDGFASGCKDFRRVTRRLQRREPWLIPRNARKCPAGNAEDAVETPRKLSLIEDSLREPA